MKGRILVLLCAAFLITGCANVESLEFSDFKFGNLDNLEYSLNNLMGDVEISFNIKNPTSSKYEIATMDAVIFRKNRHFGALKCTSPVVIEPHSEGTVNFPIAISVDNPLSLVTLGIQNISKMDFTDFTADYQVKIKSGIFSKKLSGDGVPVNDVISKFDSILKQ